jgi:hypothetical protein
MAAARRAAGSPTVNLQWLTVNLNGQYFGMFSALTKINEQYLQVRPYIRHDSQVAGLCLSHPR